MPETLVLPAKLDLPAAPDLLESLRTLRGKDVGIDASEVAHLGTNCLQVLISAARSWSSDGKSLTFAPMSEAFTRDLGQFGLSPETLTEGESPE